MPTIYMIYGFVGAGKTTLALRLEQEEGAVRYTVDEWMVRKYGNNPPAEKFAEYLADVKAEMLEAIRDSIAQGEDVILDYGFWTYAEREQYRALAQETGAKTILFYVSASDKVMEERVLARTAAMPNGTLAIDHAAIQKFRQYFEPLRADEEYVSIVNN